MDQLIDTIEPPVFLVAMPQILDPFFNRSVVLLVEHHVEGSLGFIVNRPTDLKVRTMLEALELSWTGGDENVYFGGPVQPQQGTIVFDASDKRDIASEASSVEVAPSLFLSQSLEDLRTLTATPSERMRLLVGYAGWGAGQLDAEMQRNDWLLAPVDAKLVYADDPASVWEQALKSIGIRPEQLPAWTEAVDPDKAN